MGKRLKKRGKKKKKRKVVKDPNGEQPPWEKWAGSANQGGDPDATHLSRNNTVSERYREIYSSVYRIFEVN